MGFSLPHLIVVLVVALLLFGTKRLRNIGNDLGAAVKGFKKAMNDEEMQDKKEPSNIEHQTDKKSDTEKTV